MGLDSYMAVSVRSVFLSLLTDTGVAMRDYLCGRGVRTTGLDNSMISTPNVCLTITMMEE